MGQFHMSFEDDGNLSSNAFLESIEAQLYKQGFNDDEEKDYEVFIDKKLIAKALKTIKYDWPGMGKEIEEQLKQQGYV